MKSKSGFTIIELLVVIAIISILAAILIPTLARIKRVVKIVELNPNITTDEARALIKKIDSYKEKYSVTNILDDETALRLMEKYDSVLSYPAKEADEIPTQAEAEPIIGVIIQKTEAHYTENQPIDEYWFYVRKFDSQKSGLIFDHNPPAWIKVEKNIFEAKGLNQTYDSTWQPE
ncbi:MAG: prepilin-type N-terminal cleavage/methylation domain-containing protein [Candidatus Buchananbacteria bacterium]|nr:prepilin-type N-terminal cleavage/methylation domain-containing protein [Candidatus Buchananbacteria bacterium]